MADLEEGNKAPAFSADSSEGKKISLKDYAGKKNVVLYFYPKDMTPGCTVESCEFRDYKTEFGNAGAVILGVSKDSLKSHEKFIEKERLNFPLLTDEDGKICAKFGVWKEKTNYGKKYMGIERTTFVIDKDGKIAKIWPKVKVQGHVDEVLQYVKGMGKG
jgi:peroxiredoxin Q/BCP